MIQDGNQVSNGETLRPDVCIAGAGAAGITVAKQLAGSDVSVVLLEGGPLDFEDVPRGDDPGASLYETSSGGLGFISSNRVRAFGGSTNHWAGWCHPLSPSDFSKGGFTGDTDWPVSYQSLVPYYHRAHRTCELGAFEYNSDSISGREKKKRLVEGRDGLATVTYQNKAVRFGQRYRSVLDSADNVDTYVWSTVTDIVPTRDGERVSKYVVETLQGTSFTVDADTFVTALGGVENPRLLLASAQRHSWEIGNEQYLGRYFMQHPHFYESAYVMMSDVDTSYYQWHTAETSDQESNESVETTVRGALSLDQDTFESRNLPKVAVTLNEVKSLERSQIQFGDVSSLPQFLPNKTTLYRLSMRCEQSPTPRSRVELTEETDTFGVPRAKVVWKLGEGDFQKYAEVMKLIGEELSTIGRMWTWLTGDQKLEYENIGGGGHHMGATRMSNDQTSGVVDPQCQVHGVENLYVAGSSVFPTVGFANPTLTIVALAHRLADHLATRNQ